MTQKVRLAQTGARMLACADPLPMHGYSRPIVYPRPDSEFWTGTCDAKGIGVPQLRARMRATTALTEFCMASSVTCCPGCCMLTEVGQYKLFEAY
eukprot:CAMPEP_0181524402 /NCGR_PEP_ID=MMETSP1110-20121109/68413_1 /TAXON_ID=174948 /ORGANISM="Symbiodinium sp., Strain CCMP421" /LENGTH=94 /DNA_ID=CAMNT_0023655133 /DNA_START=364 /DNA_END=649 /DNA_ORIENTATION=-